MNKEYSRIDEIPKGHAKGGYTPGCLVLEGGAFRGLYTSGVLDAMMEAGINMETVIGVSAGAMNGLNYSAGNIGRSGRLNLRHRHDDRYLGLKSLTHNHGVIGFDFILYGVEEEEPFDKIRFFKDDHRFVCVATNIETGEAEYLEKGKCADIITAIQASASMPYVSEAVELEGKRYLDGGCAVKIPYQWAIDQGYEKIVLIKTRDDTYRRTVSPKNLEAAKRFYKRYEAFANVLGTSNERTNKDYEAIEKYHDEGRIFVISPSETVSVSRLEGDLEKLGDLYFLGYHDGQAVIPALKKYLGL